jgi:hypothetical protein
MPIQSSRRRFLGALSAGAAASIAPAAIAATLAPAAEPDPIYGLLAEHREAWDRYDETDKLHADLRERADEDGLYDPVRIHLRDYPEKKAELVVYNDEEWHTRFTRTGKMIPIFATTPADIKKNAPRELSKSQRAYWVRKKKRELARAEEARRQLIDSSECGRSWEAWNTADKILRDITSRLVGSRPTSIAGAVAVLKHIAEFAVDHDSIFESDDQASQIMANIADSLRDILERGRHA